MGKLGDLLGRAVTSPIKALLPKNPWLRLLLIAVPILLLLSLLDPVLRLLEKGVDVVTRSFVPLLATPGGRLLLLNALLLLGAFVAFFALRNRLRTLRSGLALRRHIDALRALFGDHARKARDDFRRVARSRALPPPEYPAVAEDAKLKLARIALDAGDVEGAIRELTRVKDRELPKELRRSLAQLRARAFLAQGEIDGATIARELSAALDVFPTDCNLLAMLRELAIVRGDLADAVEAQERIAKHALPRQRETERQRLVADLLAAGDAALAAGDHEAARGFARRAHKVDPDSEAPAGLTGRVLLAKHDVRGAVREWGRSRSLAGVERIARLLDEQPGCIGPNELLEACPTWGAVLLIAREHARSGDVVRAERAARQAARELGPTPSVAVVLAEILTRCGRPADAQRVTEDALRRLLAPTPTAG